MGNFKSGNLYWDEKKILEKIIERKNCGFIRRCTECLLSKHGCNLHNDVNYLDLARKILNEWNNFVKDCSTCEHDLPVTPCDNCDEKFSNWEAINAKAYNSKQSDHSSKRCLQTRS